MKRFAALAMLALLSGAAWSQSTATPATGMPPGGELAPGTAASDVAPTRPVQGPSGGAAADRGRHGTHGAQGANSGSRRHDADKGTAASRRSEARDSNRGANRSASAAESYSYPASPAQSR